MKLLKIGLATAAASLLLVGCASNDTKQPSFADHCEYRPGIQAPEWYCSPDIEGGIAAVGEAQANAGNNSNFQRTEALAAGRDELARQLEVKVKNAFKNFTETTGAGDDGTFDKVTTDISRQVANTTLSGSKQLKRWVAPDNTLVLLVGIAEADPVIDNIKSSFKNEKALWQKFQGDKAQQDLDKYIEQEFGAQ